MEHAADDDARQFSRRGREAFDSSSRRSSRRKARETRRFKTLKEYSDATGQDRHSVLVDYDVFVKVTPPGPDPRTLYKPADFDFQLRPDRPPWTPASACRG